MKDIVKEKDIVKDIDHFMDAHKYREIDEEIKEVIKAHTDKIPVDIEKIIKNDKLKDALSIEDEYLGDDTSGKIEKKGDREYMITVNSDHSKNRRRFTLAHEFAHYALHRKEIGMGTGIIDDALYRSDNSLGLTGEIDANRLAAKILMPMELINQIASKGANITEVADELEVSLLALKIRLGIANDDDLENILRAFKEVLQENKTTSR